MINEVGRRVPTPEDHYFRWVTKRRRDAGIFPAFDTAGDPVLYSSDVDEAGGKAEIKPGRLLG